MKTKRGFNTEESGWDGRKGRRERETPQKIQTYNTQHAADRINHLISLSYS